VPGSAIRADWRKRTPPAGTLSLPGLAEQYALSIRQEYLRWVADLGRTRIGERSVCEWLRLEGTMSFWWMTLIAEKEPIKSRAIFEVFKLRALEHLIQQHHCTHLIYAGPDRRLDEIFSNWAQSSPGRSYRRRHSVSPRRPNESLFRRVRKRVVPHGIEAVGYLLSKIWLRTRCAPVDRDSLPRPRFQSEVTITAFFPNIDLSMAAQGRFWSRYWEALHPVLDELPVTVNWLWTYAPSPECSFAGAVEIRDRCNARDPAKYRQFIYEEFISARTVLRTLRLYIQLRRGARRLAGREIQAAFRFDRDGFEFYPLLRADWLSSLRGVVAMQGVLHVAVAEAIAEQLPARPWALFVWENQPFELALVTAWRRLKRFTIGAQHSALRRLELRSFADPSEYTEAAVPNGRPMADILAANGSGAESLLREAGYPANRLTTAEALRYMNLPAHPPQTVPLERGALLVITGYRATEVSFQLRILLAAAEKGLLRPFPRIIVKPHPMTPVATIAEFERLKCTLGDCLEISNQPLGELWPGTARVFAANSTSSAIEAVYEGLPVSVCGADDEMNLSPLFADPSVPVIGDCEALADFLGNPPSPRLLENYFAIDRLLPRWRALLDLGHVRPPS